MSHPYYIDERDMMFNLKECPGLEGIQAMESFADIDEDTVDMIFDQSKGFCQKVLAPLLAESDREGSKLVDGKVILPDSINEAWQQYRELGLIGMCSDSNYGGGDLPHFLSVPVAEMECGSFVAFSMLPLLTRGAARLVWAFGSDALKDLYLERMFSGEWTGTMCLTEPNAGSDVGAGATTAVPEGDHYKIKGTKIFISWGEHEFSDNIIHLVLARTPGAPAGSKGLSLFVVPKNRANAQGDITGPNDVICGSIEHKMGIKASPTCVINFGTDDDCIGYLLGEECKGMRYMFQMMNEARIEVGVQGMGLASAAYLSALEYAKERVQGARKSEDGAYMAKIIEHEDVRRMLLKMRAIVEGSRSLVHHLMYYLDISHHHADEQVREKHAALVDLLTPICKAYGSDQGFRVTELAVQTFGGYGYCQDYPAEQYLRDCKISSIYEGTNGIQALDLVMRKILMDKGRALKFWAGDATELVAACKGTQLEATGGALMKAVGEVVATVEHFGGLMIQGRDADVRYHATDFQEAIGHIMIGYFLLKQAHKAHGQLAGDVAERDRSFYEQKAVTARYAIENLVPPGLRMMKTMRETQPVAAEAVFN